MASENLSAGSAEPYWFEWQTGLLSLVELLDADSDIVEVAFQIHGTKGWDDVGVRFRDGRTQFKQMKHSRIGDRITFGDLIASPEEGSSSLLRTLAKAWKSETLIRGVIECVLVTNRSSGTNWYQGRPPLADFYQKVAMRIQQVASLDDVHWEDEDDRYAQAWKLFMAELSDLEPPDQLAFLRSLQIEMDAPDSTTLETAIRERLAVLSGLPAASVRSLFNALVSNLREWTCHTRRETEWINRDDLLACLAQNENEPLWLGHCEVETPEPFFPSRTSTVDALRTSLLSNSSHKVDFLAAEPGGGKTSSISKLARSGTVLWREQAVSIRFYAYRPIRPGQPDIGADADWGVRPDTLWLALLWQIRDNLRKTHLLAELRVPAWLDGMPWEIARGHVLRIASALDKRWGRCFVICIDGIDHAARARRKHLADFLGTLPLPDAIPDGVRLLLAGQPADAYPEYPFFLRQAHNAVKVHPLDTLLDEDLRVLWRAAGARVSHQAEDAIIRLLGEKTQRRTLPTVYAVEDIRWCASLEEAADVLNARPLPDSLHQYYDAIWSAAATAEIDGPRLAAAFALLRERPTGDLMASAFSDLGKSATQWSDVLRKLRPLVRETSHGFELVHNDLRVHLDASLAGEPYLRRDAASGLADHYRKPHSNRLAAQLSLLNLLITADRRNSFADDFTTHWVIEAESLGVAHEQTARECSIAFTAAVERQDWLLLHSVACASLTFHRVQECRRNSDRDRDPSESKTVPTFLTVEGEPLPFELWTAGDFAELVIACQELVDGGAHSRAVVVLNQWFGGVTIEALVERLAQSLKREEEHVQGTDVLERDLERFGRLCASCHFAPPSTGAEPQKLSGHRAAFEKGWVRGLAILTDRRKALRLWCWFQPLYIIPWVEAVQEAATRARWGEARALLNRMEACRKSLDPTHLLTLGWIAARAKPLNAVLWQQPLALPNYGLSEGQTTLTALRLVAKWITYGDVNREPAQVTEDLLPLLDQRGMESKNPMSMTILIRASAVLGRLMRYIDRGDFAGAEIALAPQTLASLLDALWCSEPDWRNLPHEEVRTPSEVGRELAETAWQCGNSYRRLLCELAKKKFARVMLWDEGKRVFDMLWECGEYEFLKQAIEAKVRQIVECLHEEDYSSRTGVIANLLHYTRHLQMPEWRERLTDRLRATRVGYLSSKEWVFQPLSQWFKFVRRSRPSTWRAEGIQLLALDRICDQQGGDNGFGDEVIAEVAAAAAECGPSDFEVLFGFLASREAKHCLWGLAKAARDGFEICLREEHLIGEEATLARIALAVALGRWPADTALKTVHELLTGHDVSRSLADKPAWQKALRIAAEMQGMTPPPKIDDAPDERRSEPRESRTADAILHQILYPEGDSWLRLEEIANLARQAHVEGRSDRASLVAKALDALDASSEPLSRCLEFHNSGLMSRLYQYLSESERWRLLGAITAITGDLRQKISPDSNWAFMVAFSAVDHACRAHAEKAGDGFGIAAFNQLLAMHWKWHGITAPVTHLTEDNRGAVWPDAVRRMLLSLTHTDACETVYMTMCGLRFFSESFPCQIPVICREGLHDTAASDAIFALAQMWATRHPREIAPVLPIFVEKETIGTLDDRLDAWVVSALHDITTGKAPRGMELPKIDALPQIGFPGDGPLFEGETMMDGLSRHNSFAKMENMRVRRAGVVLGPMAHAYRHMALAVKNGAIEFPPMNRPPPRKLTFDSYSPRQSHPSDRLAGDAIIDQCAGSVWSPAKAAAVRLLIGFGIDPWVASAVPNVWPDKDSWPSDWDLERGNDGDGTGGLARNPQLNALLHGVDLDPSLLLLGAVLRVPTFRRDLRFDLWLAAPNQPEDKFPSRPATRACRTFASWLGGYSFAASQPSGQSSVYFAGNLVNFPNSDLDVTPTDHWQTGWGWMPDASNALRFRSKRGEIVAWFERWIGPNSTSRSVCRQPMLSRWIARRDSFPANEDELQKWARRTDFTVATLSRPE